MIKIKARKDKKYLYLTATGHADFNPGNDIVCAAVSALLCTLAEVADGAVLASGEADIMLFKTKESEAVFRAIVSGLKKIAEVYGAHVRVEVGDRQA